MSGEEGFAARWSRLKRTSEDPAEADMELTAPPAPADAQPEPDPRSDAEILAELGLPDPDTLQKGDDVTGFLSSAVPHHLRRMALRRLWRLDPTLANLDGLVDHGEDYTNAATVVPGMKTVYQVGEGMVRKAVEVVEALADDAENASDDARPAPAAAQPAPPDPEALPEPALHENRAPETTAPVVAQAGSDEEPPPVRARRMVFRFDADSTG